MITTIVFDLDDTLYDELEYCKSGFDAVADFLAAKFTTISAADIFNALWNQFQAGNHTKTINAALEALSVKYDDALIRRSVEVYRNHTPKIALPEDSKNVLEQLGNQYTLALLTDGFLPAQNLKVKALDIEKYFRCIIYTEELGREYWKPSPASFEKLINDLHVEAQNCVYVADNPAKDFLAPNLLGFATVQLSRPKHIHPAHAANKDYAAKHAISNLADLPNLLKKL